MPLNLRPGVGERGQRVFPFQMCARQDSGLGVLVMGRIEIDASKFKAARGQFRAQAQNSDVSLSGVVQLYDVTAGDTQLMSQVIATDQPTSITYNLALDFTQPRVLEVRAGLDQPGPYAPTEVLILWFATIELTTVF